MLREYASRAPSGKGKRLVFKFLTSPVEIFGDGKVEAIELVRNRLEVDSDGWVKAVPTDEHETLACGLVFRSVGYRGVAIPDIPFDERKGTIANEGGRVEPGVYTAGWIKRGPSGVIGTNKKCAVETVELLLEDASAGRLPRSDATAADVDALLDERGIRRVLYAGWQSIDEAERAAGEKSGRPRVKLCTWDELLDTAERATSIRS